MQEKPPIQPEDVVDLARSWAEATPSTSSEARLAALRDLARWRAAIADRDVPRIVSAAICPNAPDVR